MYKDTSTPLGLARYQLKTLSGQFFHFIDDYHLLNDIYRALQADYFDLKRDYEKLTNRLRSRRSLFTKNAERLRVLQSDLRDLKMTLGVDPQSSLSITEKLHVLITTSRLDDSISVLQYLESLSSIIEW